MRLLLLILLISALAAGGGCTHNQSLAQQQQALLQQQYTAQLEDLQRRTGQLDSNNNDLHTQIAQSRQQTQLLRDQVGLLQQQLSDSATQLREAQIAQQEAEQQMQLAQQQAAQTSKEAEQQIATFQASMQRKVGARITANNSSTAKLTAVNIAGVETRAEGDLIRITIPTDQIFVRGSAQLQTAAYGTLDQAAAAIAKHYSRNIVVIEGHTDNVSLPGSRFTSLHALAAGQATAVFEQLTTRNQLPSAQLRIMAQGPAHPLVSNGSVAGQAQNRRIELVVYPECF
jgi:flagellar motor protein MotB